MNAYFSNIGPSVAGVGLGVTGIGGGVQEGVTGTGRFVVEPQTASDSSEPSTQSITPLHLFWKLMHAP